MSDALIKAAVEAAEKAVADMQVSVRVVAPAQPLPDPDKTRYEQLRKHLKGMQQGLSRFLRRLTTCQVQNMSVLPGNG